MITLFNYLLIFGVFAGGFILSITLPFAFYLSYIFIIFFLIIYILRYRNISINLSFLIILIILTISSLINVCFEKNTIFFLAKQVLGILVTGTAYYLLIKVNKYEIDKLFKIYLRIALIVAAIGIFQEFSFLIGFKYGYDYSCIIQKWKFVPATGGMLRVNSIFMEPAHFAITMAPAFFISLSSILRKSHHYLKTNWGSIIIIISYILTFSLVAYISILISLLLIFFHVKKRGKVLSIGIRIPRRYVLSIAIILPILIYAAYRHSPEIRMRVDDTIEVATGSRPLTKSHLSIYALASNAFVAYKSFISNPFFGHGLGSHPISYDEFIRPGVSSVFWAKGYTGVNKKDAASLFLRLISETGLFGILVVLYFVFKFRLKISGNKNLPIMSNSMFILFIMQLLRQGHYFYNGLFFFVWMYYFAYKIYNKPNEENYCRLGC